MIKEQLILQQNVAYEPWRHFVTKHTGGGGGGELARRSESKPKHIYPRTAILKKMQRS